MDDAQEAYARNKAEKQKRYEEHCEKYAEQLRLLGYISSLERDNESIRDSVNIASSGREKRRAKKLIKINDKDIKLYKRILGTMPAVPEFK